VTIRKHLSLLLVILLVFTMTSQAASAYVMACRGTATCCCVTAASSMDMTGGMDQNCCATIPSEPCDIETTSHAAVKPFLSGFVTGSVDGDMVAGMITTINDPGDVAFNMARHAEYFTDRGGPPIYLQIQTILC